MGKICLNSRSNMQVASVSYAVTSNPVADRALNSLATTVTDWSEDQSKREALVQLGRSVLIKWLLGRALAAKNSLEQAEAERTLSNLLADGQQTAIHRAWVYSMRSSIALSHIRLCNMQATRHLFTGPFRLFDVSGLSQPTASSGLTEDG